MTSISAHSTGSNYLTPLQKLQQDLQADVDAGKISTNDQSALSSALTDIDSSLQADGSSGASSNKHAPGDLKSKIDDLISGEVSSGKLTSDQASELKDVFKAAFSDHHGRTGDHPASDNSSSIDASGASSTGGSSSVTSPADLLNQLLETLQQSLSASSSTSYSASGTEANNGTTAASFSALLVDYKS
jgi:hypothetical protein